MPRDEMNSLIQKIARQARLTFKGIGSGLASQDVKSLAENMGQLKKLVGEIRAEDLKIKPRKSGQAPISVPHNPPVTYMHICETDCFSMGVFLLKSGTCIPLHDHPGMHGMLKVLYGKVRISGFDKLEPQASPTSSSPTSSAGVSGKEIQFNPPLLPYQRASLRRAVLRSVGEFSDTSPACLLSPHRDNLHQISAVDGPAAFLDILAPPYDPDDGRDCHYYKLLQPLEQPDGDGPHQAGATMGPSREVWLLEVPQPDDFWCGGEPYPGPKVSI
ncbi:2-aminoethanethiol dioxygenase [Spea bombifrons]|uniref:2-aminoethanethiol dioxygenase n=1 Tax=Spea bombifrons TaxID=233779 RepID=UPI002349EA6F|nr:2-aminoethanethiol dioxygenase [Spea bombifrons]